MGCRPDRHRPEGHAPADPLCRDRLLDRQNVSYAKLQMVGDLGLSEYAYGLGASLFFIGYFLFEVPSNVIMEKVGARRWFARIMIS
jgi:hypothetical protein